VRAEHAAATERAASLNSRVTTLSQRSTALTERLETSDRRVSELSELVGALEAKLDNSRAECTSLATRLKRLSVSRDRALSAAMVVEKELARDEAAALGSSPSPPGNRAGRSGRETSRQESRHRETSRQESRHQETSRQESTRRTASAASGTGATGQSSGTDVRETGSKLARALRRNLDEEERST
jgi:hypothetical protein